jgi:uncharacterized protein
MDKKEVQPIACRPGCGACCIVISISSPLPGLPQGKPARVRCVNLTADNLCTLFGLPSRPAVCASLSPTREMCGRSNPEAFAYLSRLEQVTKPAAIPAGNRRNQII